MKVADINMKEDFLTTNTCVVSKIELNTLISVYNFQNFNEVENYINTKITPAKQIIGVWKVKQLKK